MKKIRQFLADFFFFPDSKRRWKRKAVRVATRLLKNNHFDAIFATAPPITAFLVGRALKKKFRIPLVIDYRESWLQNPEKFFPTFFHRLYHSDLEFQIIKRCDRVIVAHRRIKEELVQRHRFLNYNDVTLVPQGFDPDDYSPSHQKAGGSANMVIAHSGLFSGKRNPVTLLWALHLLFKNHPGLKKNINLKLIGIARREERELVHELGLTDSVQFFGYLPHRDCVKHLQESDLLWLVTDNDYHAPEKMYEYFAASKHILASTVDGYNTQILKESKAVTFVPHDDIRQMEQAILALYAQCKNGSMPTPDLVFVQRYNRKLIAGELARILETLMDIDYNALQTLEENRG